MSTKIFNALRALHSTDPFEVAQQIIAQTHPFLLNKVGEVARNIVDRQHDLTHWGDHLDFQILDPQATQVIDWQHLYRQLPHKIMQLHHCPQHTWSNADVLGDSMVLPSRLDDSVLILNFGAAAHDLTQLLIDTEVGEDYHYQNQVDPPEDLDGTQAWSNRKIAWTDLDDKGLAPNEVGLDVPQLTISQMTQRVFDETHHRLATTQE